MAAFANRVAPSAIKLPRTEVPRCIRIDGRAARDEAAGREDGPGEVRGTRNSREHDNQGDAMSSTPIRIPLLAKTAAIVLDSACATASALERERS